MNKKNTARLKDYILIIMGIVISIAGIIFIIRQYSKLLSDPTPVEGDEHNDRFVKKVRSQFKQIHKDEGNSPELLDEGDLLIEIE